MWGMLCGISVGTWSEFSMWLLDKNPRGQSSWPIYNHIYMCVCVCSISFSIVSIPHSWHLGIAFSHHKAPCSGIRRRAWTGAMVHTVSKKQMKDYIYIYNLPRWWHLGGFWRYSQLPKSWRNPKNLEISLGEGFCGSRGDAAFSLCLG